MAQNMHSSLVAVPKEVGDMDAKSIESRLEAVAAAALNEYIEALENLASDLDESGEPLPQNLARAYDAKLRLDNARTLIKLGSEPASSAQPRPDRFH
jgi:hypothetical protein